MQASLKIQIESKRGSLKRIILQVWTMLLYKLSAIKPKPRCQVVAQITKPKVGYWGLG